MVGQIRSEGARTHRNESDDVAEVYSAIEEQLSKLRSSQLRIIALICWSLGNLFQFGNQNRQRHLFDPAWFYGFIAFALENGQLLA